MSGISIRRDWAPAECQHAEGVVLAFGEGAEVAAALHRALASRVRNFAQV